MSFSLSYEGKLPFGKMDDLPHITPAVKYHNILLAQISICRVVINRWSNSTGNFHPNVLKS